MLERKLQATAAIAAGWKERLIARATIYDAVPRLYWSLYLLEPLKQSRYDATSFNSLLFPAVWTVIETILLFTGVQIVVRLTNLAYRFVKRERHRYSVSLSSMAVIGVWIVTDILIIGSMTITDLRAAPTNSRDALYGYYETTIEYVRSVVEKYGLESEINFDVLAMNALYSLAAIVLLRIAIRVLRKRGEPDRVPDGKVQSTARRVFWAGLWFVFTLIATTHAEIML